MRALRRKWLIAIAVALAVGLTVAGLVYFLPFERSRRGEAGARLPLTPQAPSDLAKVREPFQSALAAYRRKDYASAAKQFASFDFGGRAVEEYRLYYLARSAEESGNIETARRTLGRLWSREPQAVVGDDAGLRLGGLFAASGDWDHAAGAYRAVAAATSAPTTAASARWGAVESHFYDADIGAALEAALDIAIKSPASPQAAAALAVARSISGTPETQPLPLSFSARLERAVGLLRDRNPSSALDELDALAPVTPASLRDAVTLNRGLALNQLRRFDDSNKVLEPLTSGAFKTAIPALYTAAKNYRALSSSINPIVTKTVVVRQKVGTVKVKKGKGKAAKTVSKPKYAKVRKTVQLVDLAKKEKKAEYDRLSSERLRDLLQLHQTAAPVRLEVLNTLAAIAEAKNQDDYEQQLVREIVSLDQYADPGLQHFWDKGWAAYTRGDLGTAKPLFRFIAETYANPNVKRQAAYWYARSIERIGDLAAAKEIYTRLAAAPYEDLYAMHSEKRGAPRTPVATNPTLPNRPDWRDIAEKTMPAELRLAYELTALSDFADAQPETERNATFANRHFADALRAQKLNEDGNLVEMYGTLRRAFPLLATVEQDSVPPYFLKMYYPVKYEHAILKNGARNGVDPYLVMALILQESYFDPRARSRVGATGLMQLMPATGKELGRQLHGVFSNPRLEDPDTNIELGTFHLKHLLALFDGNAQLVAASYNAGQGNVLKWRKAAPRKPMDEFLESIPFPETRNYVKRVTLLRSAYTRIAK